MRKIFKSPKIKIIISFILGAIIFGGIGVVATNYLLKAEDVEYKNNKNLQDAIDELYGMAATHCPDGKTCLTNEEKTTLQNTYLNECPGKAICITGPTMQTTNLVSSTGVEQQGLLGIVYLDPTDLNNGCNASNSLSTTEKKTGCMKWYAYKLANGNYTMILDHNTTATVAYNSSNSNTSPTTIQPEINALTSTSGWVVTPRLISADEIAGIVGNTDWHSASSTNWFYLDSKNTTQTAKSQGASAYSWLFDYTNECTSYGCNTVDSSTYGYWTSSKKTYISNAVWLVHGSGRLSHGVVTEAFRGLRPVIEVSSSILNIS